MAKIDWDETEVLINSVRARERGRIRRALRPVIAGLRRDNNLISAAAIDAATRAPKRHV